MKKFLKILAAILAVIVLFSAVMTMVLSQGLKAGSNLEINGIDLSSVKDGVYNGKYDAGRFSNQLNVTVKDHKITKIEIVKDVTFASAAVSEAVFTKVIEEQKIQFDAIAGATVTSKAYLKAIENAFGQK
ncbi:MAG TPA: FMN-binding protein [Bacillota bacterium]|nr:FMN-binding protein [Bacillota bacterium]